MFVDTKQFDGFYSCITDNVKVSVMPKYIENNLNNKSNFNSMDEMHVWSYTVVLSNNSPSAVQLLKRLWITIESSGVVKETHGDGVVGLKPVIQTGESFEYSSSVNLTTTSGMMMGKYIMQNAMGESFEIVIPTFSLDCPDMDRVLN